MTKTDKQDELIRMAYDHENLLYRLYTGFGKSRVAIRIMEDTNSEKKWLVLVPKIVLIDSFMDDYFKWALRNDQLAAVICYDSLYKYEGEEYNVICDEAHHCTDSVLGLMETIKSDRRLFLTATISEEVIKRIDNIFPLRVLRYNLAEAIDDCLAPEQDIRRIDVPLDADGEQQYTRMEKAVEYWRAKYYAQGFAWQNNKWMYAALQRKNWMATYKLPAVESLLSLLESEDKRFICFVNSVEQAIQLGEDHAISYKGSARKNQARIKAFNSFEIDSLFTKDILSEGVNLNSVDCSVYLQLDGSESKTLQKTGRTSARSEFPIQYIFVIPGTRDEEYFNQNFSQLKQYIRPWKPAL